MEHAQVSFYENFYIRKHVNKSKINQYYHKTFTILTLSCILLQNGHTYLNIWCLSMHDYFPAVCMTGLKLVLFLLFVFLLILPNESPSKIMKNAFYFI